jgi:phosphoadenosine phosphosulfate reductase
MMQKALPGMTLPPMEQPLDRKIELAIKLLQGYEEMALQLSPDGFYLAFSGGKDSIVIKELAKMACVKFKPWYNQTTIDPPELIYYMQEHHKDVEWNRAKMNMCEYLAFAGKGPPTRINRWCCQIYKEGGGDGLFKIIGVRASESARRKAGWSQVVLNNRGRGPVLCPVLYWTDEDIWSFIKNRKIPYCVLYDQGFSRLGCIGCPMSGEKGAARDFKKWPKFEKMWKMGIKKYFDKWKNILRKDGKERWLYRFSKWEELWSWWVSRKGWIGEDVTCQTATLFSGEEDDT